MITNSSDDRREYGIISPVRESICHQVHRSGAPGKTCWFRHATNGASDARHRRRQLTSRLPWVAPFNLKMPEVVKVP
jgi:hypothetical protein